MIGGFGNGIAYITPVATVTRWFPERRGLAGPQARYLGFAAGALTGAGDLDGARRLLDEAEALASGDDLADYTRWLIDEVRADILIAGGDLIGELAEITHVGKATDRRLAAHLREIHGHHVRGAASSSCDPHISR